MIAERAASAIKTKDFTIFGSIMCPATSAISCGLKRMGDQLRNERHILWVNLV